MLYDINKMKPDFRECIKVDKGLRVTFNSIMFDNDVISSIEIHKFQGENEPCIFVTLFMGNIRLCSYIYNNYVVINEDKYSDGRTSEYNIHLAREYELK